MPLQIPHGEHPDGDPFAEQDAFRDRNSLLGRMEARARAEAAAADGSPSSNSNTTTPASASRRMTPTVVVRSGSRRSARANSASKPTPSKDKSPAAPVPMLLIDDSDDLDSAPPVAAAEASSAQPESAAAQASETPERDDHGDTSMVDESVAAAESRSASIAKEAVASRSTQDVTQDDNGDVSMNDAPEVNTRASPSQSPAPAKPAATTAPAPINKPLEAIDLTRQDSSTSLTSVDSGTAPVDPVPGKESDGPATGAAPNEPEQVRVNVSTTQAPARARSKTPPPLPQPKVQRTIRLQIDLPRPGTSTHGPPTISVSQKAIEAGYKEDSKDEEGEDGSDEDEGGDDESESDGEGGRRKKEDKGGEDRSKTDEPSAKKKRKRGPNVILGRYGGYDVEDPFVDDSEADLYEPKYYVRPAKMGFFVCTGLLELETQKRKGRLLGSKNKPKGGDTSTPQNGANRTSTTSTPAPEAGPSHNPAFSNYREEDLPTVSSMPAFGSTGPLTSIVASSSTITNAPPKRAGFSPELKRELEMLERETKKEDFSVKNKFPPRLRPILTEVALKAIELDEYDDAFFGALPKILPYNLFTLKKLVKREVFPHRISAIEAQIDEHIDKLRMMVHAVYATQKRDFEQAHQQWERDRAQWEQEQASKPSVFGGRTPPPSALSGVAGVAPLAAISGTPQSPGGAGVSSPGPNARENDDDGPPEPKWKFRCSEPMRLEILHMCDLDDQMTELHTEKQTLEKAAEKGEKLYSHMNARKSLYTKILAIWEPNDMTTNQISREMSAVKNKLKRKNDQP